MTLKNKILKALGREEVQWYREFGVLAPFCPYCGEPAYYTHRCAFCGKKYIWRDSPHPPTIAEYGDYTAAQTDDSILIFNGDRLVYHASYTGDPMTEDELKDHIAFVFRLGMTDD